MGAGFSFDVELRIGAGAYVCGEETALFQSIEGYRGEPRNKPPFPVEVGLFGKPTVVNNVETLFNVLEVVSDSGAAYAAIGTEGSTGTRLFCLSGHVEPAGPLRGAVRHAAPRPARARRRRGRRRRCCSAAPPARSCGPTSSTSPLTFEDARAAGATLGSGRRDRLRRVGRPRRRRAPHRRVLPRRVVRPVRALPRRHGAPGGGAAPARRGRRRTATSSPCSPTSRR